MTTNNRSSLKRQEIKPKWAKRIIILQRINSKGKSKFFILHKRTKWTRSSLFDVPKFYRVRNTFEAAERAALFLAKNYTKYFLD